MCANLGETGRGMLAFELGGDGVGSVVSNNFFVIVES